MESAGNAAIWSNSLKSAWSKFIHSLLLRCPEDLATFREVWRVLLVEDATGEWEDKYQSIRTSNDPLTFQEYMANIPRHERSESTLRALIGMIDSETVGIKTNNLVWHVRDTSSARHELLTSDRPVLRTNGLLQPGGHLALAIGPRRLFIATRDKQTLSNILRLSDDKLVQANNEHVVAGAARYVYGTDDRQLRFVQNRFGEEPQPRLVVSISGKRDEITRALTVQGAPPLKTRRA